MHLSITAPYDPAEARLAWTRAALWLTPLSSRTSSLSPEFNEATHLDRVTGGTPFILSYAWNVSDASGA